MSTLTCAICGFKAEDNLVPHMRDAHPEVPLSEYMRDNGGEKSLVSQELMRLHRDGAGDGSKKASVKPESGGTVKVAGIELSRRTNLSDELKALVPKKDPNYEIPEFAPDVAYCISKAKPVALTGHCGCGKTSLIYEIAARLGQPVIRVNTNQQTTLSDFVGHWGVKGGTMEWVDGALPYAMRNGAWLIIDEIDYAEPSILSALNAVLEPARQLMLTDKGNEIVKADENFRFFATGNTLGQMQVYRSLYQGTNLMNEAFVERWRLFLVNYLDEEKEIKVLCGAIKGMTQAMAKRLVSIANAVRKAHAEETVQCTFSTRRLLDWAEMIVVHKDKRQEAPFKAAEATIFSKISKEDETALRGIMQRTFFSRNA